MGGAALSGKSVIYHSGGAEGAEFRDRVSPLRGSAHSAVESKGMAISLEKSRVSGGAKSQSLSLSYFLLNHRSHESL